MDSVFRDEFAQTVGRLIARRRAALEITQEQLSIALDVDPMTISRFERGVTLPSLLTVRRLADVFGISMAEFFDESQPAPRVDGDVARLAMQLCPLDEDEREFALDTLRRFCALSARRRP